MTQIFFYQNGQQQNQHMDLKLNHKINIVFRFRSRICDFDSIQKSFESSIIAFYGFGTKFILFDLFPITIVVKEFFKTN